MLAYFLIYCWQYLVRTYQFFAFASRCGTGSAGHSAFLFEGFVLRTMRAVVGRKLADELTQMTSCITDGITGIMMHTLAVNCGNVGIRYKVAQPLI